MPGFLDDADTCNCGHIKDEHDVLDCCTIETCSCDGYEWSGVEEVDE